MDTLIGCVYKDCGWPATVFVRAPEISGEEIPLCDGCIADWGMKWRDDHSELIEEHPFGGS